MLVRNKKKDGFYSSHAAIASTPTVRIKVEEYFPPEEITITEDGYFIVRTEHAEVYGTLLSYGTGP
jgi:hypothetical protein